MQARAARVSRLLGPRQLVFEDEAIDWDIGPLEMLVATEFSAISPGTELAAYAGLPPLRPGPVYPRLVGYCNCGRVVAAGKGVRSVAVGDRILTHASHRSHFRASEGEILAIVPADLDGGVASVAYLFHLGYVANLRADVGAGQRVAIIGLGTLGLASVAVARCLGAEVTALSRRGTALQTAQRFGADVALTLGADATISSRADVVITTANRWDDWLVALRAVRVGGTIAVLGFPGRGEPLPSFNPLASQYFYDKQLRLLAVGHASEAELATNMPILLDLIARGELPAVEVASHRRPATEIADAYEELLNRPSNVLTTVLEW